MDSAKYARWIIPLKKFGMVRVKFNMYKLYLTQMRTKVIINCFFLKMRTLFLSKDENKSYYKLFLSKDENKSYYKLFLSSTEIWFVLSVHFINVLQQNICLET